MPNWEVIYKASADFADLTRKAKEAEQTLKSLQRAAKEEADAEADGAAKAAIAHDADTEAIKRQTRAMEEALGVAKAYNAAVNQGGRSTMDQHLSDIAKEKQQTDLLNRSRQRGFTTPQQDYSYRQQEITQRGYLNRANWEGFQTKDQYLASQVREKGNLDALNTAWAKRAVVLRENAEAVTKHVNAQNQQAKSLTQVATTGGVPGTVSDARTLLRQVTDDIAKARTASSATDSSAVLGQLSNIKAAISEIQKQAQNLDLQPQGLDDLQKAFRDAQQSAARAFPDIEAKGRGAATGVRAEWMKTRGAFSDVFTSAKVAAADAGNDIDNTFARTAAKARAAFSGFGGGAGGGGLASAFGDLFKTVSDLSSDIPGKIGLIGAAIMALVQILPALSAGLGALAATAATLPDFLGAAAGAFITFQAAIMPVIEALQKYGALVQAQQAVQAGTLATIMQQQQAYHGLADAQFALSQATIQAGNQQITAAHAVADAQFALKEAYFQAGLQQQQSAMEVSGAEHSLSEANYTVTQSQYALNIAWQQARFQLKQLELTVSGASLNLRGAQLSLEEAQQNYAQVMAQSTSTALDRAQAAYAVQQAEQQLKQVELTNKENEKQLADVRKYGMQQVFGVTAAQHGLVDAQYQQIQAQKQLSLVQKEAANEQLVAAHAIIDAIYGVQQAQFQQQQGAIQSAHSITDAQFTVLQSQEQLKEAAQAGGQAAVSAYDQFQQALAELSPAAKKAVDDLKPLFLWWSENTKAQQAFFGVFDKSLERLGKNDVGLIRPLNEMLDAIARALGKVAAKFVDWFAKLANSPLWTLFTRTSVKIIEDFGSAGVKVADAIARIAAAAAPLATWIAKGVLVLAGEFDRWAKTQAHPGSLLHMLLNEAKPALKAVEQLLKSIVFFFGILAGAKPVFKDGILTSLVPGDSQNSAFQTFIKLMTALANNVLPVLAQVLNKLASPALANALITLLEALSQLLLQVVTSPGFLVGFTTFVNSFSVLVGLFAQLVQLPGVGDILGAALGALIAINALKFTGFFALVGGFRRIAGYVKGIKDASGILGKLGAIFGAGGSGPSGSSIAAAGDEAAAAMGSAITDAGATAAEAMGAAIRAAGATAAEEEAAGTAGSGAAGDVGAAVTGTAGRTGIIGTMLDALKQAPKFILELAVPIEGVALIFHRSFGGEISYMGNQFKQLFIDPVSTFFKKIMPQYLSDKDFEKYFRNINGYLTTYLQNPTEHFFGQLLPDWLGGAGQGWQGLWKNANNWWVNDISDPFDNFFSNTVPGWFDDVGRWWSRLWNEAWGDFQNNILHPVENWFSHTLPSSIAGAFKTGINWVINNVINKVIGWINDIVGKIPGVPHIRTVGTVGSSFAEGGHLGFAGGGPKQDNRLIWASDGEYVINAESTRRHRALLDAINSSGRYASGGEIVNYAENFVGKVPYLWGGTSTRGWDCSGMVWDIYRHFGINPPRTADEQFDWVKRTKYPEVGGLAFGAGSDGSAASPGHVGIVVGPNRMVNAYGTGYGTRYDSISGSMGPVSGFGIPPHGEGAFGAVTDFGKKAISAFEHIFGGAAHGLESMLKAGALKSFNWLWGHTVVPLERQFGLTGTTDGNIVGSFAAKGLDNVRLFVDHLLANASPSPPAAGNGPTTADAAVAQQYAKARLGFYGWGANQWPSLQAMWTGESGWDRFARNPISDAFGIPQALPYTKMPKKAWPMNAGGDAAAGPQIDWGMGYIKGTYGTPETAYSRWLSRSPHWYALGGPVAPGGPNDVNFGHAPVSWLTNVQWPHDKPSPTLAAGGPVSLSLGMPVLPETRFSDPKMPMMAGGGSVPPRQLSAAAAAGRGDGGASFGDINIYNPLPERAGDSLTRSVMKAQFLAGRGIA